MSYKTLYITDGAYVSLFKNRVKIKKENIEAEFPMDDIGSVILDGYQISVSLNILNAFSSAGINTILCDGKRLPSCSLMPFEQHSRQYKVFRNQIEATEPFKKKLWQEIIKAKIKNQNETLIALDIQEEKLINLSKAVLSGDSNNREAVASKIYFEKLLNGKRRSHDIKYNSCLDYAYSIVRSAIARSLAGYGFYTSIGIHHKSELNQFNLADDIIETFRPLVDFYVFKNIEKFNENSEDLSVVEKSILVQVLNYRVSFEGEDHTITNTVEKVCQSFRSSFNNKDVLLLKLPSLCK